MSMVVYTTIHVSWYTFIISESICQFE